MSKIIENTTKIDYSKLFITLNEYQLKNKFHSLEEEIKTLSEERVRTVYKSRSLGQLNEFMAGGFRSGTFNIITGSSGGGKSMLALNLALDFATQGIPVLFVSTELGRKDMSSRFLAQIAKESISNFELVSEEKRKKILDIMYEKIKDLQVPIDILYENDINNIIESVENEVFQRKGTDKEPRIVFIDHFDNIYSKDKNFNNNEMALASHTIQNIQKLWIDHDLCVIGVNQMRKLGKNETMGMHSIRGSAKWYYLASQILAIEISKVQEEYNNTQRQKGEPVRKTILLAKQRFGLDEESKAHELKFTSAHEFWFKGWRGEMEYGSPLYNF